jgi:hypothetical protein
MNQAFNHHPPRLIRRRQAFGLFAKAGAASVLSTVPLRDLGQGSTSAVTGKYVRALRASMRFYWSVSSGTSPFPAQALPLPGTAA